MILKPEALEELLSREPEEYEDADIMLLIEHLRTQRKEFIAAEATGKTRSTRATKSADPTVSKLIEDLL